MTGRPLAYLVLPCLLALGGCGKHQAVGQALSTSSSETNQASAPQPPPQTFVAAPAVLAALPDGGADLKQLNHVYVAWIVQHRLAPKSYEEFISLSGVQVPPPPAGKKYVIDKYGFINYANF